MKFWQFKTRIELKLEFEMELKWKLELLKIMHITLKSVPLDMLTLWSWNQKIKLKSFRTAAFKWSGVYNSWFSWRNCHPCRSHKNKNLLLHDINLEIQTTGRKGMKIFQRHIIDNIIDLTEIHSWVIEIECGMKSNCMYERMMHCTYTTKLLVLPS